MKAEEIKKFKIRPATASEIPLFLSLAEKEGWNPGIEDATPFFAADPKGFFVGEIDGEKIGTISAVSYKDQYAFIGFFIVIPSYRSQGFGSQLFKFAMEHLKSRTIGLDGVLAQQKYYEKCGFQLSHRNIRFKFTPRIHAISSDVIPLQKIPFENVEAYDASIFGFSRSSFLKKWINMPNAHAIAYLNKEKLFGYGVIRKCQKGWKIGPLFADNQSIACKILEALSSKATHEDVFFDVPASNTPAVEIATQFFQMTPTFETARMYFGTPVARATKKEFGVTSFELG